MATERALRGRVLAIGAIVVLSFIGEASYDSWRLHQQIMSANTRELGNLSRSLATQADRAMQSVDSLLGDTAVWLESSGTRSAPNQSAEGLARRLRSTPQVDGIEVFDKAGKLTYQVGTAGSAQATDASGFPFFTAQKAESGTRAYIYAPVANGNAGGSSLIVSRRLSRTDGRFDGVVVATVSLRQLREAYKAIDLGNSSALLLTLDDGTLVIRQPVFADIKGRVRMPELVAMRAGAPITRMISLLDKRPKLIAAVGVAQWPLILAVQRDEADALRPWFDELKATAVRSLLLIFITAFTIAGILRQLKRAEASSIALRKSENRYAMAMDAANEGHAEWNLADDCLFLSAKWRAIHGLPESIEVSPPSVILQHVTVHPEDLMLVRTAIGDHLANRSRAIEIDYRVLRGSEWAWIHARGRCLRGAEGTPLSLFCSATDISDRKREEQERSHLELRLQQTRRLEALGTLAGGIAHDFNNILGAILGFGEMAQQRAEEGSVLRRHIDRVMQSGLRARLLVRRILDFSRSGIVERSPVNVQAVVEEVVAILGPTLPAGISLEASLDAGSAAVNGDATQLHQVAMNLGMNAVQAMREGRVEISLSRKALTAPTSFLLGDLAPGEYVHLEVADEGTGIPPEDLTRIFDPFFTTKAAGQGTGLGLSVVHGIVSNLHGGVDVSTRPTGGTCVSVWLPISGDHAANDPSETAVPHSGAGQVVMVVDDEEALREMAEELLAELGYEPVGYPSAECALAAFKNDPSRFDLVLTDQVLPGMQGSDFARHVLAIRPNVSVALMSGNLSEETEIAMLSLGVRAVLHKPLGSRELAVKIAALVHG